MIKYEKKSLLLKDLVRGETYILTLSKSNGHRKMTVLFEFDDYDYENNIIYEKCSIYKINYKDLKFVSEFNDDEDKENPLDSWSNIKISNVTDFIKTKFKNLQIKYASDGITTITPSEEHDFFITLFKDYETQNFTNTILKNYKYD